MTDREYDCIDTDFGTELTDRVTRIARKQLAAEQVKEMFCAKDLAERDRIGRIAFKSAGATRKR